MELGKLKIYSISVDLSNQVWSEVITWDSFSRYTIGKQLVRAADSIAANISEGYGRYHYKEEKQFLFYARGSLYETKTFLTIAFDRKLLSADIYDQLISQINILGPMINSFINTIGKINNPKIFPNDQ